MAGTRTHGWGLQHRGSGQKGGAGNSGRGKKAQSKKPEIWGTNYFGKYGFTSKVPQHVRAINIIQLETQLKHWNGKEFITEKNGEYTLDLTKAGYTKLLGTGTPTKKLNITIKQASPRAIEKIKSLGGTVHTSAHAQGNTEQ